MLRGPYNGSDEDSNNILPPERLIHAPTDDDVDIDNEESSVFGTFYKQMKQDSNDEPRPRLFSAYRDDNDSKADNGDEPKKPESDYSPVPYKNELEEQASISDPSFPLFLSFKANDPAQSISEALKEKEKKDSNDDSDEIESHVDPDDVQQDHLENKTDPNDILGDNSSDNNNFPEDEPIQNIQADIDNNQILPDNEYLNALDELDEDFDLQLDVPVFKPIKDTAQNDGETMSSQRATNESDTESETVPIQTTDTPEVEANANQTTDTPMSEADIDQEAGTATSETDSDQSVSETHPEEHVEAADKAEPVTDVDQTVSETQPEEHVEAVDKAEPVTDNEVVEDKESENPNDDQQTKSDSTETDNSLLSGINKTDADATTNSDSKQLITDKDDTQSNSYIPKLEVPEIRSRDVSKTAPEKVKDESSSDDTATSADTPPAARKPVEKVGTDKESSVSDALNDEGFPVFMTSNKKSSPRQERPGSSDYSQPTERPGRSYSNRANTARPGSKPDVNSRGTSASPQNRSTTTSSQRHPSSERIGTRYSAAQQMGTVGPLPPPDRFKKKRRASIKKTIVFIVVMLIILAAITFAWFNLGVGSWFIGLFSGSDEPAVSTFAPDDDFDTPITDPTTETSEETTTQTTAETTAETTVETTTETTTETTVETTAETTVETTIETTVAPGPSTRFASFIQDGRSEGDTAFFNIRFQNTGGHDASLFDSIERMTITYNTSVTITEVTSDHFTIEPREGATNVFYAYPTSTDIVNQGDDLLAGITGTTDGDSVRGFTINYFIEYK